MEKHQQRHKNAGNGALASLPTSFDGDTRPYAENILFDNSPLNRLFQVLGVGMAWATANKTTQSYTEVSGGIRSYTVASDGSVSSGTYPANSLYKKTLTNEQGNKTIEYTDKEGRIVQKEQELNATETAKTAYIFRDNGQLAFVVQPHVYASATSFTLSSSVFLEGCFGYIYDPKGRLVEKHIAGGGWTRYIYDRLNRVVLENDDKDLVDDFYKFTKFDAIGRTVQTGLINNIGSSSRTNLQTAFNEHLGEVFEERGTSLQGYTNRSFPNDYTPRDGNLKTVSFYDDFLWNSESAYDFELSTAFHPQYTNVKGMATGSLVRNLETNAWYKSINYYDYKARNIQTFSQNHLGGIDRMEYQYRFNSEVLKMRMEHQGINEIYEYETDHAGRKKSFKHTLNGTLKNVAKYEYDATGRLKSLSSAGRTPPSPWHGVLT